MSRKIYITSEHIQSLKPKAREYTVHDTGCLGLGLRIQPGGSKSWVMSHRIDGKTRRVTLGAWPSMCPDAARTAFFTRQVDAAPAVAVVSTGRVAKTLTFAELADRFLTERGPHFKPSTLISRRAYLNAQLLPAFGSKQVGRITPPDLAKWFHAYSVNRPGGANEALALFTTLLNWGKSQGHLPRNMANPASPIRKNRRKARGRMLSFVQIQDLAAMIRLSEGRSWLQAQAIRLTLLTGCRKGEILSLRWSNVKRSHIELKDSKTGPRDVYLSAPAQDALAELKRATGNHRFVFPSARSRSGHLTSVAGTWSKLGHYAGLPNDIRIHDLRHTYASHAILAGESLPIAGKLLGHKSPRSTQRYAHLDGSTLAKAADKVSRDIARLLAAE